MWSQNLSVFAEKMISLAITVLKKSPWIGSLGHYRIIYVGLRMELPEVERIS
jgi:hypothetical protein